MLVQGLILLSLGGLPDDPEAVISDDAPPLAQAAVAWVEAHPEQAFDIYRGEALLDRVSLEAKLRVHGDSTYIELAAIRRSPPDSEHAVREVAWLRPDSTLSPYRVMLFEATKRGAMVARVGVDGGKLTGTVMGKGIVRNVPAPVSTGPCLLLRAGLLAERGEGRERFTRLAFGRRGAVVKVDEHLVITGIIGEGDARITVVEHREARGKPTAIYRFGAAGALVGYETLGGEGERWVPYISPDED